jgi:membrane protein
MAMLDKLFRPPRQNPVLLKDAVYRLAPWLAVLTLIALWPRPPKSAPPRLGPRPDLPGMSEGRIGAPRTLGRLEPGRGREARRPAEVPLRGWKDIVWRTWREINADRLPAVAGGVTFYALLAIFPAIAAFVSLYGLFADVSLVGKQLNDLSRVFPAPVISLVGDQMLRLTQSHHAKLGIAFAVSVLLSIWSANAGMTALCDGLNIAYDEAERRSFVKRRALTLGFTAGLVGFVAAASWLLIGLPEMIADAGLWRFNLLWGPLRWVVILLGSTLIFAALFRFGPCRAKARWRWVRWGAVFSSLTWLVGSLAFSTYLNTLAHYDATYGPLGAVVAFMVWLWFSIMAILIGAELNAEIEHQTAVDSTTGPELPMGERGAAMADTVGRPFQFDPAEAWARAQRGLVALLRRGAAPS